MSIQLRELIRQVRACKTAAEERSVIAKEGALCRQAFKDKNDKYRHRNVAKLLYIHMLGYPTHFGQMESLKLIASTKFSEKRIGYLALMLLLDERQDILMLVTNALHGDFKHTNQYVVGLALCALGNISSTDMARNLQSDVRQFFSTSNVYLRKKAILCATRIVRKVPELIEDFISPALLLLRDKNHAVLLCTITLLMEMINIDERQGDGEIITKVRKSVPSLVRLLKNLVLAGYVSEYDVCGVTDPFLQTKIMQLLRLLGTGNAEASEQMNDILAQVSINTESTKNTGDCILYECVQTIMAIEAEGSLRVLAVNILGRFLLNRDNNIRYVALNILSKVVDKDTLAIQRHRNTIVDCLKDSDISIRRRALDLIYALVTEDNIQSLVKELLNYLALTTGDVEFKTDLTDKICHVAQKYHPNKKWHIETMINVLTIAGDYTREEVTPNLITLISRAKSLYAFIVFKLYHTLKQKTQNPQLVLVHVGLWCIGEYGDLLTSEEGAEQARESASNTERKWNAVSMTKVLNLMEHFMRSLSSNNTTKEYILNALIKLSVRFQGEKNDRIKKLIGTYKRSMSLELQQRSCEYSQLISSKMKKITPGVISRMPIPKAKSDGKGKKSSKGKQSDDEESDEGDDEGDDDDDNDDDNDSAPETETKKDPEPEPEPESEPDAAVTDILDMDLLSSPVTTKEVNDNKEESNDVVDLLGGLGGIFGDVSQPAVEQPSQSNDYDSSFMDLFGASEPQQPKSDIVTIPPKVVFESKGLTVTFNSTKKTSDPSILNIEASFTNSSQYNMTNWEFQVAVPKYLKLKMEPASGNVVPANNGGSVTQSIRLENTMLKKKMRVRVRLSYTANGKNVVEQAQIDSLE